MKTIRIESVGGPERLQIWEEPTGEPLAGELRLRHTFIGVNVVDIYHRTGIHPLPAYPAVPGVEAVGIVEAVGDGVRDFAEGDRVAYGGLPAGSYAEARNIPVERAVKVPDGLSDRQVAGSFLRGLTAYLLVKCMGPVDADQTVLVHAAAGGLGLILTQWLNRLGAKTIGTVGSPEKADIARAHGLDQAILYKSEDFVDAARELTGGRGVDWAVDGIGGDTFRRTFQAVRPFGTVANIGQVAGDVSVPDISLLTNRFLIRPSILAYLTDNDAYRAAADAWFAMLRQGLDVSVGQDYPFVEAAKAHADMEAGRTAGAVRLRV